MTDIYEAIACVHEAMEGRYDLTGSDLYDIHFFLCQSQSALIWLKTMEQSMSNQMDLPRMEAYTRLLLKKSIEMLSDTGQNPINPIP